MLIGETENEDTTFPFRITMSVIGTIICIVLVIVPAITILFVKCKIIKKSRFFWY